METGLSLVAVGQGLAMNPDWVRLAEAGLDDQIDTALLPSEVTRLAIPPKLWSVIEATKGWFTLRESPAVPEPASRSRHVALTPSA
jgi:hypothetical protein